MVLFVCYSGAFGGAERLLLQFARALEVQWCVACPEGPLADALREAGINVFVLPSRTLDLRRGLRERVLALARLAAHAREVRSLVRAVDPEVVVAWSMRSAIAAAAAGLGRSPGAGGDHPGRRPRFVFQHNDLLPGPVIGQLVRAAAARADLVLALSQTIASDLDPAGELGPRLRVVLPGVDVESFSAEPEPPGPPEVLVLGAIVDWKRPDLALEAFAQVRAQRPDLRLRLVGAPLDGDDTLLRELVSRAQQPDLRGSVQLDGQIPDPRPALARATCLLHCADREPFGMAVLEALAAGRPAVVPSSGGPAEIVDAKSGVFYPPGDAAAAAQALLGLLADPEHLSRVAAGARERAREFDLTIADRNFTDAMTPLIRASAIPRSDGAELAVVTVSHNSAPELAALLRSVARHLPAAHVIVADNASNDGSVEVVRAWAGHATVLELGSNAGFGIASNRALHEVREPVAALLNPDVELLDDTLLALARELGRAGGEERILAPAVLRPDGTRQDSVHPVPTSVADLTRALIPPALLPGRAGIRLAPWRSHEPRRVGWAVGCALVARTTTLQQLGPFDEQIFLYGEDLELGLRSGEAGVQTWFWPAGRVLHRGAHSSSAAFGGEPFERLARARHDVIRRRLGPGRARCDALAQAITFVSRAALKLLLRRPVQRERDQLRALARVARDNGDGAPRP